MGTQDANKGKRESIPRIGNTTSPPSLLVPSNRGKGWSLQVTKASKGFMLREDWG